MRRARVLLMSVGALTLALSVLASGCGGAKEEDDGGGYVRKAKPTAAVELQELVGTGTGTLHGRATLEGPMPDFSENNEKMAAQVEAQADKAVCKMGDITQQQWKISKDGGVANVYVWLRPPEGFFFKLTPEQVKVPEFVELKQDHCFFEPHALKLFPSYYDSATKKLTPTGQKLKVNGSPVISHNVKLESTNTKQAGVNRGIEPGKFLIVSDLKPDPNTPVLIGCDIHKWMSAVLWVHDHPFVAITDKDGNYKIEGVPTGVDLQVVAWHEQAGWLTENKNSRGDKAKLDKDNLRNIKVVKK